MVQRRHRPRLLLEPPQPVAPANAPPAPYALKYPEDGEKRPVEAIRFAWDAAEPGIRYTLRIAKDKAFKETLLEQAGLEQNAFDWSPPTGTAGTCYWRVAAVASGREGQAVNGPFAFTLDPALPSSMHGVVVRSALAGGPSGPGRASIPSPGSPSCAPVRSMPTWARAATRGGAVLCGSRGGWTGCRAGC